MLLVNGAKIQFQSNRRAGGEYVVWRYDTTRGVSVTVCLGVPIKLWGGKQGGAKIIALTVGLRTLSVGRSDSVVR